MNHCFSSCILEVVLEEIREQMKDRKITVNEFASKLGVSRVTMSRILHNSPETTIKAEDIFYIFERLGMKVSY